MSKESFPWKRYHRTLTRKQVVGINEHHTPGETLGGNELTKLVQAEVIPYNINLFRTEEKLTSSLSKLNNLWNDAKVIRMKQDH
jgi:hypothetical protein